MQQQTHHTTHRGYINKHKYTSQKHTTHSTPAAAKLCRSNQTKHNPDRKHTQHILYFPRRIQKPIEPANATEQYDTQHANHANQQT